MAPMGITQHALLPACMLPALELPPADGVMWVVFVWRGTRITVSRLAAAKPKARSCSLQS